MHTTDGRAALARAHPVRAGRGRPSEPTPREVAARHALDGVRRAPLGWFHPSVLRALGRPKGLGA